MLLSLHIKNLAIIDEEEIDFGPGLNILSGETGAGKSIILGALALAMGKKAPKGLIRNEDQEALSEAVFAVNEEQRQKLGQMDIDCPDGEIILQRKITPTRTVSKINGENMPVGRLTEVAALLVDIYGQHEQQTLLSVRNHIKLLDEYASGELDPVMEKLRTAYTAYKKLETEYSGAGIDDAQRAREADMLGHEINRIESAGLLPGEDESLRDEYRLLTRGEKIAQAVAKAEQICAGDAAQAVAEAIRALKTVQGADERVDEIASALSDADSIIGDALSSLRAYGDDMDLSPERLRTVSDRLDELDALKRMFSDDGSIEGVLASLEEKRSRLEKLNDYEAYIRGLEEELNSSKESLLALCREASGIRKIYAEKLSVLLTDALLELNFQGAVVDIRIERLKEPVSNGFDDVCFYVMTNAGDRMRPLNDIASGGELSRIMLALKTIFASSGDIDTLIFDEIDSGVSGRTAAKVASRLEELSGASQVICITHLPQIAARASDHYLIEKKLEEGTTVSSIRHLSRDERIWELARMLAGDNINDAALENAKALMQ